MKQSDVQMTENDSESMPLQHSELQNERRVGSQVNPSVTLQHERDNNNSINPSAKSMNIAPRDEESVTDCYSPLGKPTQKLQEFQQAELLTLSHPDSSEQFLKDRIKDEHGPNGGNHNISPDMQYNSNPDIHLGQIAYRKGQGVASNSKNKKSAQKQPNLKIITQGVLEAQGKNRVLRQPEILEEISRQQQSLLKLPPSINVPTGQSIEQKNLHGSTIQTWNALTPVACQHTSGMSANSPTMSFGRGKLA